MKMEIKVPKMGESIVEATIGRWLKEGGSSVKEGDEIVELETEKVNQVLHAPASGQLQVAAKAGDKVKIGQTIGSIDTDKAGAVVETPKEAAPPPAAKPQAPPAISSMPSARKKVDAFVSEISEQPAPAPVIVKTGRERREKMSKIRRVIADRLVKVKNETAMLTTFNEVDMSAVIKMREDNQEAFQKKHGVKLGFMSFFVKACASALQEFPEINGRIEGDEIVYNEYYDIGVAVGTDRGLFVPVIRNVDQLSYAAIEKQLKTYAEKAKSGTISIDEMQGGTFTITNGGVYGSMLSTPIINPPQSAILGMHNIVKRPVVINDEIVIRPIMYLALSYDHRIVDGKSSIGFVVHVKKLLEEPARALLDL